MIPVAFTVVLIVLVIIVVVISLNTTNKSSKPSTRQPLPQFPPVASADSQIDTSAQQLAEPAAPPPVATNLVPQGFNRINNLTIDWESVPVAYRYGEGYDTMQAAATSCLNDPNCKWGLINLGTNSGGYFTSLPSNRAWRTTSDPIAVDFIPSRLSPVPRDGLYTPNLTVTNQPAAVSGAMDIATQWASGNFDGNVTSIDQATTALRVYLAKHPEAASQRSMVGWLRYIAEINHLI